MSAPLIRELQVIRDEFGALNAELVVGVASNPEHPLHSRFEWDDTIAAHKYRLDQAGQLLRVMFVVDLKKPTDMRAFVAVKGQESHKADYVPTREAMEDEFTRKLVLASMKREWMTYKRKYDHMVEFADFIRRQLEGEAS
jgi:hypothetical protein